MLPEADTQQRKAVMLTPASDDTLQLARCTSGAFMLHCYLLWHPVTKQAVMVDTGADPSPLLALIDTHQLKLTHVLYTHAHLDHVEGWPHVVAAHPDVQLWGHEDADFWLDKLADQARAYGMVPPPRPTWHKRIGHGDALTFDGFTIKVRFAPGHAPESLCYVIEDLNSVIVGDVIFYRSIGRTDFPRGNHAELLQSIHQQIFTLPPNMTIYSGHGPATTVGAEKDHNPYCG
jgi:hydroxyacylglutathione hydrolase